MTLDALAALPTCPSVAFSVGGSLGAGGWKWAVKCYIMVERKKIIRNETMKISVEARRLNEQLVLSNPAVFKILSIRGKAIFFPREGILSQSAQSAGKEINATIGIALEDDGKPMYLKSIARQISAVEEKLFPYAPSYGRADIRKTWHRMIKTKNPAIKENSYSLPVVTAALTHGLSICGYLFGDIGDKIILPDLYWENYDLIFSTSYGMKLDTYRTFNTRGGFDISALEKKISAGPKGKKMLILNFPNNPAGYTPTNEEVDEITKVLYEAAEKGNKIVVFVDDAYFGLVYEKGIFKESIFTKLNNLHRNILAVKLDGPTKEDYVWGFRVGFITYGIKDGDMKLFQALEDKTAGAVRATISNVSNLSQSLLETAYGSTEYLQEKNSKYEILERRYRHIKEILKQHPEYRDVFEVLPFNSGYFLCVKPNKAEPEKVRQILLARYSTGVIVMTGVIRLAFSSTPYAMISKLLNNLYLACLEAQK